VYPINAPDLLRAILTWSIRGSSDSSPGPEKVYLASDGTVRLEPVSSSLPTLDAPYSEEDFSPRNLMLGFAIMGVVIAAVYWASQKLTPTPVVRPPSFGQSHVRAAQAKKHEGIFVIGPPRMSKDDVVGETVHEVTGAQAYRIKLLDADLSKEEVA